MHATFILKCNKCGFCMQQCNAMEVCTMFMTFFPIFMILIWFFFLWKRQIDCFFSKDVITHATPSYLLQTSSGTPSVCIFCLIQSLDHFGWWKWSRLTLNQSIEIRVLGFPPPFLFKTSITLHNKRNIRPWDQSHAPLQDGSGLLHFGIWPSETFLI